MRMGALDRSNPVALSRSARTVEILVTRWRGVGVPGMAALAAAGSDRWVEDLDRHPTRVHACARFLAEPKRKVTRAALVGLLR